MMSDSSSTSHNTRLPGLSPLTQPDSRPDFDSQLAASRYELELVLGHATEATSSLDKVPTAPVPDDGLDRPVVPTEHNSTGSSKDTDEAIEMEPIGRSHLGGTATASSSRRRSPARRQDNDNSSDRSDSEQDSREGKDAEDLLSDEDLQDDEEMGLTGQDRQRRTNKRTRNTQLDQRIVKDRITSDEIKEADKSVLKKLLINATLIGLWYFFSLSISLYNKWMFDPTKLNFPFPLFTTATHMLVQFTLASLVLLAVPSLRPQNAVKKSQIGQPRPAADEPEKPVMTKMFYLTRIGPCGMATGLDIGLGNTSLQFITLTFYTMCKSSSLAFVLIFAFLFRLETPTWKLVAIIATMTFGVVMMVAGEVEFDLGGFILVISAAFFSGFRWGLTQILLLRNPATSNPFASIFFLAPVMFLTLIIIAVPTEGVTGLIAGLGTIVEQKGALMTPLLILFPGTIAFLMTASEFALLQRTSVVTLSIAGIFKEAVTISAAAIVFGDTMTPINVVGLLITLFAIAAYNYIKITKMRSEARTEVHREHLGVTAVDVQAEGTNANGGDEDGDHHGEDAVLLRRSSEEDDAERLPEAQRADRS
ncbi:triose-phosphate transporter family-domain-containing protein [Apodospora peruviana]|uniref:Triose-phosphate transporter family-domain-containing protein n=1 Tax=Apodospora peruviana TaxID=516989 RepID=A0AAE0IRV6_9PEZI|nr:triose-phosphate transporter family-domain-containing protein [Apodospora peruviana]